MTDRLTQIIGDLHDRAPFAPVPEIRNQGGQFLGEMGYIRFEKHAQVIPRNPVKRQPDARLGAPVKAGIIGVLSASLHDSN